MNFRAEPLRAVAKMRDSRLPDAAAAGDDAVGYIRAAAIRVTTLI